MPQESVTGLTNGQDKGEAMKKMTGVLYAIDKPMKDGTIISMEAAKEIVKNFKPNSHFKKLYIEHDAIMAEWNYQP